MRHVSVWPAYVLHITLQRNAHARTNTRNTLSSKWTVENICDQSLVLASWVLRLHETSCQRGTWESLSLSLIHSVPFSLLFFFFFFFLCCSALYLWLIISHKHSPPTHTHTRCKHKRSQYVGCNEYVTWRPDSRSLCFLVWLMWQQSLTFFFFLCKSASQLMCVHVLHACGVNTTLYRYVFPSSPSLFHLLQLAENASAGAFCQPHIPSLSYITDPIWLPQPSLNHLMNIKATNVLYIWYRTFSCPGQRLAMSDLS